MTNRRPCYIYHSCSCYMNANILYILRVFLYIILNIYFLDLNKTLCYLHLYLFATILPLVYIQSKNNIITWKHIIVTYTSKYLAKNILQYIHLNVYILIWSIWKKIYPQIIIKYKCIKVKYKSALKRERQTQFS